MNNSRREIHYTIAWIAPLRVELAAAKALLDDRHDPPDGFAQLSSDDNSYTWGRMGNHNVVVVSLPDGTKDLVSAAVTVANLTSSLTHIRIGLLVGIGGGIPRPDLGRDIRLGDVVISQPQGTTGGVVQYDQGRVRSHQIWEPRGSLNRPPSVLLNALANLRSEHLIDDPKAPAILGDMWKNKPRMKEEFVHQGAQHDRLFDQAYSHVGGESCDRCDESKQIPRDHRQTLDPVIHYGIIASGNTIVKDAVTRDQIATAVGDQCICLETEAAGLMNHFPCLVIRGISDYADSHKNDRWQKYAAVTAAAYAKELLQFVPVRHLQSTPTVRAQLESINQGLKNIHLAASHTRNQVESVHNTLLNTSQKAVINRLPVAVDASYDSASESVNPRCLPDTRVELLDTVLHWAKDDAAQSIFWLNGMAGTGKSTVSRTLAESLANSGRLGGSFFFKRSQGDRGTSKMLFTTIAAQLATTTPGIAPFIRDAIDADVSIGDKGLKQQFDKLILTPLSFIASDTETLGPRILVIDALDECELEEAQAKRLLELFSEAKGYGLKTFITSRPELPIRLGFSNISGRYRNIVLHDIAEPIIRHDLSVFFNHQVLLIRSDYNASVSASGQLPHDWPGSSITKGLVKMASPLFIYAATVCRFIADWRCGDPEEQLATILQHQRMGHTSQLKATYLPVLDNLVKGIYRERREIVLERFHLIVGTIIVLASPLCINSLAKLLSISMDIIEGLLRKLHSVLHVPEKADGTVRLLHLSFRDFLLDHEELGQEGFCIDETLAHKRAFDGCLDAMDKFLRADMCDLQSAKMESSTVDSNRLNSYIPQEVQYACIHWITHFEKTQIIDDQRTTARDIGDGWATVQVFFSKHFLHWVEALGLMGRASESLSTLKRLQSMVNRLGGFTAFLEDGSKFLRANMFIISSAPLQVYYSALLFAPQRSDIRRRFQDDIPRSILYPPATSDHWSSVIYRVKYDRRKSVSEVLFSPDSKLIASSYTDGSVDLWKTETGAYLFELKGRGGATPALETLPMSFSLDSKLLATSSEREAIIRLWGTDDGVCVKELRLSPADRIWFCFTEESAISVALSVTGMQSREGSTTCVCYSSNDDWEFPKTIKVFNWISRAVAFSRNSEFIASISASDPKFIYLWNIRTCSEERISHRRKFWYSCSIRSPYLNFSVDSLVLFSRVEGRSTAWNLGAGSRISGIVTRISQSLFTRSIERPVFRDAISLSSDSKSVAFFTESSIYRRSLIYVEHQPAKIVPEFDLNECKIAFSHDLELFIASPCREDSLCLGQIPKHSLTDKAALGKTFDWCSWIDLSSCSRFVTVSDGRRASFVRIDKPDVEEFTWGVDNCWNTVFSKDSNYLATNLDGNITVWRSATLERFRTFEQAGCFAVFSPDSTMIATWDYKVGETKVWQLKTGRCLLALPCFSVVFTADSKQVASVCKHLKVTTLSIETGEISRVLHTLASGIRCPRSCIPSRILRDNSWDFSPNGQYLATAWEWNDTKSEIRICPTIRICRIDTDEIIATFVAPLEPRYISFEPSTGMLLTGNAVFLPDQTGRKYHPVGYSFSQDLAWITYNGRRLIWLPAEYRPFTPKAYGERFSDAANASAVAYITQSRELKVIRFIEP